MKKMYLLFVFILFFSININSQARRPDEITGRPICGLEKISKIDSIIKNNFTFKCKKIYLFESQTGFILFVEKNNKQILKFIFNRSFDFIRFISFDKITKEDFEKIKKLKNHEKLKNP